MMRRSRRMLGAVAGAALRIRSGLRVRFGPQSAVTVPEVSAAGRLIAPHGATGWEGRVQRRYRSQAAPAS